MTISNSSGGPPPVDASWLAVYEGAKQRAATAGTAGLREHAQKEVDVIALTLRAMGHDLDGGKNGPSNLSLGSSEPPPPANIDTTWKPVVDDGPPPPAEVVDVKKNRAPTGGPQNQLADNIPPALEQYRDDIESASRETGVPANLIAAMIWQESRGIPGESSTNSGNGLTDIGLMQINPETFKELQQKHPEFVGADLSDPSVNIRAGSTYVADLKDKFGSWELAERAYNSGAYAGVDVNNPHATPAGTGDPEYVRKVTSHWNILDGGTASLPP